MNLWKDLSTGSKPPKIINVVVEVPKGSSIKYKFESVKKEWYLKVDKILYSPLFYAGNYGIIPRTMRAGGYPLDCLVLMDEPVPPETVIPTRPVALLKMLDNEKRDDKVVAAAVGDSSTEHYKDLKDIGEGLKEQISEFFSTYKRLGNSKVEVLGWKGVDLARKAVTHAQKIFEKRS